MELAKSIPSPDQPFIDIIRAAQAKAATKLQKHPITTSGQAKASSSALPVSTADVIDLTLTDSDSDSPTIPTPANRFQAAFESITSTRPEPPGLYKVEPSSPNALAMGKGNAKKISPAMNTVEEDTVQSLPSEMAAQAAEASGSSPSLPPMLASTANSPRTSPPAMAVGMSNDHSSVVRAVASKNSLHPTIVTKAIVFEPPVHGEELERPLGPEISVPKPSEESEGLGLLSRQNNHQAEGNVPMSPLGHNRQASASPVPSENLLRTAEPIPSAWGGETSSHPDVLDRDPIPSASHAPEGLSSNSELSPGDIDGSEAVNFPISASSSDLEASHFDEKLLQTLTLI
jgi:hypothetical protein